MEAIPNPDEINAATGFLTACTALIALIIRAIEKKRDKRKLKRAIREGTESLFEDNADYPNNIL